MLTQCMNLHITGDQLFTELHIWLDCELEYTKLELRFWAVLFSHVSRSFFHLEVKFQVTWSAPVGLCDSSSDTGSYSIEAKNPDSH